MFVTSTTRDFFNGIKAKLKAKGFENAVISQVMNDLSGDAEELAFLLWPGARDLVHIEKKKTEKLIEDVTCE